MSLRMLPVLFALIFAAGLVATGAAEQTDPRIEDLVRNEDFETIFVYVEELRSAWSEDASLSPNGRALRLHALGNALYDDDRIPLEVLDPALDMIVEGAELLMSSAPEDTLAAVEVLEDGSTVYFSRREFVASTRLSERRLDLLQAFTGATTLRRDLATVDHGKILHADGQFERVVEMVEPRVPALRAALAQDPAELADALTLLANCFRSLGQLQRSADLQRDAFDLLETRMEALDEGGREKLRRQWVAQSHNLATTYIDLDQLRNAELRYRQIESYCASAECAPRTQVLFRKGLAAVARRQLRYEDARERLESLLTDMQTMPQLPPGEFGLVHDEIGWLRRDQGDWAGAELSFTTALDSLRQEGKRRRSTIPRVMRRLAESQARQGKTAEAVASFDAALEAIEDLAGADAPAVGVVLTIYGEWLISLDDPPRDPSVHLDRAIEVLGRGSLLLGYRADALAARARLHWSHGETDQAVQLMGQALRDVEYLRAVAAFDAADRARVFSTRIDHYLDLMRWHFERGDEAAAWITFERSRARALLESLDGYRGIRPPRIEEAGRDSEEVRSAQTRVAAARAALQHASPGEEAAALREYDHAYRQLMVTRSLERGMQSPRPEEIGEQEVVDLDRLRTEVLGDGEMLLAYARGSTATSLIVVRPGTAPVEHRILPAPPTGSLDDLLLRENESGRSLLDRIRSYAHPFDRATAVALADLADVLIPADLRPQLARASGVIILPDGPLHRLPVDALVLEVGETSRETVFWLDRFPAVRYAPSATTLWTLHLRAAAAPTGTETVVVADPDFGGRGDELFPPLPYSRREAEALRRQTPGATVLSGPEATERALRRAVAGAGILHLATHGVVEARARHEVASLILTAGGGEVRKNDGFLDLDEIGDLGLRAELTVLSACSSHEGRQVPGEGVFALTRAFLLAGSDCVVGTLWPVQDFTTAWAMEEFYQRYLHGRGRPLAVSRALHAVKQRIRAQEGWADPAHWSAFVATGIR